MWVTLFNEPSLAIIRDLKDEVRVERHTRGDGTFWFVRYERIGQKWKLIRRELEAEKAKT